MRPLKATPPLVMRADADGKIGIGHVMRCLALAQAWRKLGGEVVFCGRIESEALRARLQHEDFALISLIKSHPDPNDLETLKQYLAACGDHRGWIVLDGYHLTPDYQQAIQETGWRVLVVDDTALYAHYHADILLNQNVYARELAYRSSPETVFLLGTRYLLLREEFFSFRPESREIPAQARHILITLGGADPDNASATMVDGLAATGLPGLTVRVVVGPANPHRSALEEKRGQVPFPLEIVTATDGMAAHLAWADAAVSGGGTTSWELAYLGIPFAVAVLADNQRQVAAALSAGGAALSLGEAHDWREGLARTFAELLGNRKLRLALREQARQLVDGRGAERVVRAMLAFELTLRPAAAGDCELIFQWANEPLVRQASFHPEAIGWDEHRSWFAARLADPSCLFFVAMAAGEPVGQVRFDLQGEAAVISIALGREWRGGGIGARLIRKACLQLGRERRIERVTAFIRQGNEASARSFCRAGFRDRGEAFREGQPARAMEWLAEERA